MTPPLKKEDENHKDIRRLKALYEIAKILGSAPDLDEVLPRILSIMSHGMGMKRGGLLVLNCESNHWDMRAAQGLSPEEMKRRKEYFGSGVVSRILEKGHMAAVVDGGDSFWCYDGKTKTAPKRSSLSFLCVPVKVQGGITAILAADHVFEDPVPVTEDFHFLAEISGMLGETMGLRKAAAAENRALVEENWGFRKELEALGRSVPKPRSRISLTEILEERISGMIAEMDLRSNGYCLYDEVLNVVERTLLQSSLEKTKHVQLKTARFLGINRNTLRRKIKELGICAAQK